MISVHTDYPLDLHNSLGFCVTAKYLVELESEDDLPLLFTEIQTRQWNSLPRLVLGGGSNIVFTQNFPGLVIKMGIRGKRLLGNKDDLFTAGVASNVSASYKEQDSYLIEVAAGENWHDFVMWTLEQQWFGLENLALIPGLVGGAPIQNIGAYGVEMADYCHSVRAYDIWQNKIVELTASQCQFAYRDSLFKQVPDRYIITQVRFQLPHRWNAKLAYAELAQAFTAREQVKPQEVCAAVIAVRSRKLPDPKVLGNVGSFFKNPVIAADQASELKKRFADLPLYLQSDGRCKLAAAWLIEQCGFKGWRSGAVGVYDKQALVLVHFGAGSGVQLLALAKEIQAAVARRFDVNLEFEPKVV